MGEGVVVQGDAAGLHLLEVGVVVVDDVVAEEGAVRDLQLGHHAQQFGVLLGAVVDRQEDDLLFGRDVGEDRREGRAARDLEALARGDLRLHRGRRGRGERGLGEFPLLGGHGPERLGLGDGGLCLLRVRLLPGLGLLRVRLLPGVRLLRLGLLPGVGARPARRGGGGFDGSAASATPVPAATAAVSAAPVAGLSRAGGAERGDQEYGDDRAHPSTGVSFWTLCGLFFVLSY